MRATGLSPSHRSPSSQGRRDGAGPWRSGPILARETGFQVEVLRSAGEREQAFRLRHRLFAETLHWVPEQASGLEVDGYDAFTEMLGILDGRRRVLGQVRMHESQVPYMLEREFASVLAGALPLKARDTAEITRFGVDPEARSRVVHAAQGDFDLFTLLLKGVYRWSLEHRVGTVFAVVDRRVYRLLHLRGFPFEAMAEPRLMPDGVTALAIRLDWRRFEAQSREQRPGLLAWFAPALPAAGLRAAPAARASRPWLPPGADSPRPASARYS